MTFDDPGLAPQSSAAVPAPWWAHWVQPQRVFPLLALVFGLSLAFLTAPFQAPDEPAHFYRAYQISEGHFLPVYHDHHGGGDLPASLETVARRFAHVQRPANSKAPARPDANFKVSLAEIADARQVALDPHNRHFIRFVSAIYSPASYVPQAAAIFLACYLGVGPLALMYAGRIGNLVLWIALSYLALRITPACRRPLLLLLLMPMTLFQAASLSADPTTNALAVLFAAMVLRYVNLQAATGDPGAVRSGSRAGTNPLPVGSALRTIPRLSQFAVRNADPTESGVRAWLLRPTASRRIGPAACVAFAVLAALLALTKFVYLPLLALVFLIAPSRIGGAKRYFTAALVLGLLSLAALAAWTSQTRGLDTVVMDKPGVNPAEQLHFLRSHPSHLWTLLTATLERDGSRIVHSFVGRLGWLDTPMSYLFTDGYLIVMFVACWLQQERSSFSRLLLLAVTAVPAMISTVAIALLNYLYTVPVGENVASGVQGRYLIPLAPAIIVLLWGLAPRGLVHAARDMSAKLNLGAALVVAFSCVYTLIIVWLRYYGRS